MEDLLSEPHPGLEQVEFKEVELMLTSTGSHAPLLRWSGRKLGGRQCTMKSTQLSTTRLGSWSISQLGTKAIGLKWVFKLKRDEAGEVIKHKARLVARGFVQQAGADFDEVYVPVARMESVQVLLALIPQEA
jgi:hypothetical protein